MITITASDINQKLKALPTHLLYEVDRYIEFITSKPADSDWAKQLSEQQILLIEKGKNDIEQQKLMTHIEAKERIKDYIKNKSF